MTKEDFYFRLVLNVLVGVMYVYALYRMARHTELNEPPTKKTFTKVFGCLFVVLGVIFSIAAISFMPHILYPSEALKGYDAIVRPSSAYLYWGYPTAPQSLILTTILNSFLLFGIGGYCLAYMKTANSWWKKTGQFVLGFLLSIVMYSATNFHYFDVYEFIAPALFLVLWWSVVLLYRIPKQVKIDDIHGDIKKRNIPSILPHITDPKFSTRLKNGNPQGNEARFETETMSVINDEMNQRESEAKCCNMKQKIMLGFILLVQLGVFIGWFALLKLDIEYGLGDIYVATLIPFSLGLLFILFVPALKNMRDSNICLIISFVLALTSVGCYTAILFSSGMEKAKIKCAQDNALNSNDIDILNKELDRRFLSFSHFDHLDKEFYDILRNQAEKNNGMAQGILGEYYYSCDNVERAFYWWKRASENNDARGLYRIGNCYAHLIEIDDVSKDLNLAFQYWTKAAEQGYGMAYKRLGDLYGTWEYFDGLYFETSTGNTYGVDFISCDENGDPTDISEKFPISKEWRRDISKAREYWQKAVESGGTAAEEAKISLEQIYPEEKKAEKNFTQNN